MVQMRSVAACPEGVLTTAAAQVWVTALPAITGRSEEKLAAAATTRMLCELPALQVRGAAQAVPVSARTSALTPLACSPRRHAGS